MKACVAEKQPGQWIQGGNWVAASFAAGEQTRATLEAVAPANPVLLNDEAHHSVWVNSRTLQRAGVTRRTPDPEGGIIERDAAGEPTGLLRENATKLVERIIPRPSMDARRKALILASHQMLPYGVTSFTVASVRLDDIGPLSALSAEGLVKQRMRGCIVWIPDPEDGNTMGDTLIAQRARYEQPRFRLDCVKMFLDGVPTESHTAAMIAPYADIDPEHGDPRSHNGLPMMTQPVLDAAVTRFDAEGLSVRFHAAGDGAVRAALDAVAAARRANGFGGQGHVVAHATFVDPADIPRARAQNVAWEFSPYIWYPTPITSVDILRAVGPQRMERWMPIREAVDTGALVVAGSDWSVVPSVNPWPPIETMVTRQKPGGSGETIGAGERVRIDQALRIFTVNGARVTGSSDKVGTIAPGMQADLIVLDRNPYRAPITQVHDTKVLKTFIAGELVYDAASPPPLTAR